MTHVFVAPHPDDVALSCGGLIASLRELGQNVTIITVFSGDGASDRLSAYQREALGFGSKTHWPATEAFNRSAIEADWPTAALVPSWAASNERLDATQSDADAAAKRFWQRSSWYRRASIRNESLADQPVMDDLSTQGAVYTDDVVDAAAAGELMARRRVEDERFAYFAEASIVFLDLPDAVFRGYEGDDELLGAPRDDDAAPFELLRQEIARLEPQKVYLPLGVGGHVDHQLCRDVGIGLLREGAPLGDAGTRLCGHARLLRGLPVRLVERLQGPRPTSASTRSRSCPTTSASVPNTRTSPTSSSARSWASACTRASSSACSTARWRWPRRCAPTAGRWPRSAPSPGPPSGTGPPAASESVSQAATTERWSGRHFVALGVALVAGILIRLVLLPTEGLTGDLDQFVLWVHGIAVNGLGNAYDQNLSFPAGHGLHLGRAGGGRTGVPDRRRQLRPVDPDAR